MESRSLVTLPNLDSSIVSESFMSSIAEKSNKKDSILKQRHVSYQGQMLARISSGEQSLQSDGLTLTRKDIRDLSDVNE